MVSVKNMKDTISTAANRRANGPAPAGAKAAGPSNVWARSRFARVLYFSVGNGRLRFRFRIDPAHGQSDPAFEVTFIAAASAVPLFSANEGKSVVINQFIGECPPQSQQYCI